jgi:hypothetical protein
MMSCFRFFFLFFTLTHIAYAEIKNSGEEDVLSSVSQKLSEIDQRLKTQKIYVGATTLDWPEWEDFKTELLFAVAHDPNGTIQKDTPAELHPTYLTHKLKQTWIEFEASASEIGELTKDQEWQTLKLEMEKFFKFREEMLYQPARAIIKSGVLLGRINKIKHAASNILKDEEAVKNVSVKIISPQLSQMSEDLSSLNQSVMRLKELRNPPKIKPTIFQRENSKQLFFFAGFILVTALFLCFAFIWLKEKFVRTPIELKEPLSIDSFNYYEWLNRLENNLQALKKNEENLSEEFIKLKTCAHELTQARKNLNVADNHEAYYASLEKINHSSAKIEELFEKVNLRKNSEASRRIITQVVQLCDAVEARKEMNFEDEKPKLKVIKQEQITMFKVA